MTCKDCIYRAMCYKHEHYGYGYEYNEKPCEMFKNKADVVKVDKFSEQIIRKQVLIMAELIVRIKDSDFSKFAGYYYTNESYTEHNEQLNEYIKLYKTDDNIKYLQIECERHFPIHTIAYICNQIEEKYFMKTDFAENSKDNRYWLCFAKNTRISKERGGEK